jgi:hypothetical protein
MSGKPRMIKRGWVESFSKDNTKCSECGCPIGKHERCMAYLANYTETKTACIYCR